MIFEEFGNEILMTKNDNATYKGLQFTQTCIENLINVYPYMITNNVSFVLMPEKLFAANVPVC